MTKPRSGDNVTVCVRVRPLNSKEKEKNCNLVTKVDGDKGTVLLQDPSGSRPEKLFTFDNAFPADCRQADVYNICARPIVESVLEGYNGTIFAYGQTGTGKTFTMAGDRNVPELRGIIPNSFAHIFGHIAKQEGETQFLVRCSYLEIYCEEVRDLLSNNPTHKLKVREKPDTGVYVDGLSAFAVKSTEDLERIMNLGDKNRVVGATNMNAVSSRSHAIFTLLIERCDRGEDGEDHIRVGKLHLVDLAGSERQSKTGAVGQRFAEATKINLSLTTLGNVISNLVDGRSKHVPYRDSVLTRLLQDSLGGNSKTTMIATFGPADYNYDETMSTLRYADRAKQIKNKPKINEDPKDAMLREFLQQIQELKKQLEGQEGGASGSEEEESEEEEEEEVVAWDGTVVKRPKRGSRRKITRKMSSSQLQAIQAEIDREKKALEEATNMAASEKSKVEADLKRRQEELEQQQQERQQLEGKLNEMKASLVVGGVDLLEKAKEQEALLNEAQQALQDKQMQHKALEMALEEVDAEKIELQNKYSSLEEEVADITDKCKKLYSKYTSIKTETEDIRREQELQLKEMEDTLAMQERELQKALLVIDHFIPSDFQDAIEALAQYDEETDEWQLPGLAFTGNALTKTAPAHLAAASAQQQDHKYADAGMYEAVYFAYDRPTDKPKARPKTAALPDRQQAKPGKRPKRADKSA